MQGKLTNTYAAIKDGCQEGIHISLTKPFSYLRSLSTDLNAECKIIQISSLNDSMKSPTEIVIRQDEILSSTANMENVSMEGSPLLDSDMDSISNMIKSFNKPPDSRPWKDDEECYGPIDISAARKIIAKSTNIKNQSDSGWIFLLTKTRGHKNATTFILSTGLSNDNMHITGIGNYHGVIKKEERNVDKIAKWHSSLFSYNKDSSIHHARINIDTKIESFYAITPNITLKFQNYKSNPTFDHVDKSSEVTLYQKIEIGKCQIYCETLWNQIQLLDIIKSDIVNYRNGSYDGSMTFEPLYRYGLAEMTVENLQEKVRNILTDIREPEHSLDSTLSLEEILRKVPNRYLGNITDQLWDLLKFSASYLDLKRILTYIFQFSIKSGIVNTPTNENRLAELIRGVSNRELSCPNLVSTEPLELLFEIGVEKLMKDFEFIFKQSKIGNLKDLIINGKSRNEEKQEGRESLRKTLVNVNNVSMKTSRKTLLKTNHSNLEENEGDAEFKNSRFNEREADLSIAQLLRIYLTIEHVISIQNHLTSETGSNCMAIAKKICEKPLQSMDELKAQRFDKFEYTMSNIKVVNFVRNLTPTAQRIVLKSSNKLKSVCSVFYYDIEQIVPFLDDNQQKNETNAALYHMYSYNTVAIRTAKRS